MEIQHAGRDDAALLAEIIQCAHTEVATRFELTQANCPHHPSFCTESWVSREMEKGREYFLLTQSKKPIGCVAMEVASDQEVYLERLSVLPEKRHLGAGTRLVAHIIGEAVNLGVESIGIGIISKHDTLKTWYEGLGFEEVGEKRFDHLPFTVSFMSRRVPVCM